MLETNGNGYPVSCPSQMPVQRQDDTFVTVLAGATDCPGVAIYRATARVACVDLPVTIPGPKENLRKDARTVLSSNGTAVAIARLTESGGPVPCTPGQPPCNAATVEALNRARPGNPFAPEHTYEVLIVDATSGTTRTLATGLKSPTPPALTFNAAGSHLLVRWPFETFSGP